ncbi:autophagy-related protein 27-domain-containing protein [Mycena amicta]|nr:autophagy-related protein 27-domain-containing protein [Mycena amicta]
MATHCSFTLDGLEFNLCPLLANPGTELQVTFSEPTPPTETTYRYTLGLGAPIKRDGKLPAELQCNEGTYMCLVVINTRPNHPSEPERYLQVVPIATAVGLNPKAKLLEKILAEDVHEPLQITLHGGVYNNLAQKASFQFHCDHTVEEPSSPQFSWQFNGTHTFSWRSPHACPRQLPPGAPSGPIGEQPDPDPPSTPPPDPDADSDEPVSRSSSWSLMYMLFWASVLLLLLHFVLRALSRSGGLSSLFARKRRRPRKGFRPPSSSLVKWAEEEEQLDDYDADASTPLTPTFKTAFASSQYGSAG